MSYEPAIIVATPGRLWELMNDQMDPYLSEALPMVDVLVLDEADRMIADGHFKEMRDILAQIYTHRLQVKQERKKGSVKNATDAGAKLTKTAGQIELGEMKNSKMDDKNFFVGKNLDGKDAV